MTRVYDEKGTIVPVTIVQAGPCAVTQVKTQESDGYNAVQIGFGDIKAKFSTIPLIGHTAKAGVGPRKHFREIRLKQPTDVQATLREELGEEMEPYLILGACNPPLAHRALETELDLGVLLPCNVVVYERDGTTHVSAVDAERMLSIIGNDALAPIASDVRRRLAAVVERAVTSPAT